MSKRFANTARPWRAVSGASLALVLAACGASTPQQTEVTAPRERVAPAPARAPAGAEQREPVASAAVPEARRERRGDRRAAEEAAAAAAAAAVVAPIPETASASHARALTALRSENWLEAELELEQLTAAHPDYPGPYVNLALVYLHDGRRADARAALDRALALEPGHAAANTQLGIVLREEGKFEEAETAYRRALATEPDHALAHYNLGVLLDMYLRRPAEALEHYEAYQGSLAEPNEAVGRWIIDLRRRSGAGGSARVAEEGGP